MWIYPPLHTYARGGQASSRTPALLPKPELLPRRFSATILLDASTLLSIYAP